MQAQEEREGGGGGRGGEQKGKFLVRLWPGGGDAKTSARFFRAAAVVEAMAL